MWQRLFKILIFSGHTLKNFRWLNVECPPGWNDLQPQVFLTLQDVGTPLVPHIVILQRARCFRCLIEVVKFGKTRHMVNHDQDIRKVSKSHSIHYYWESIAKWSSFYLQAGWKKSIHTTSVIWRPFGYARCLSSRRKLTFIIFDRTSYLGRPSCSCIFAACALSNNVGPKFVPWQVRSP
jgi:hypothetical protein